MEKLLIVEGDEDEKFFRAVLRSLNCSDVIVRSHPSGKGNALNTFKAGILKQTTASRARLGIVVDADFPQFGGGYAPSVTHVNDILGSTGWSPLQRRANLEGHITANTRYANVRCGVWIMPDNQNDGFTEQMLLAEHAQAETARVNYARRACSTALASALGFPTQAHHRPKAEIGTWLAWQDVPRMSFAVAYERGLFDRSKPLFSGLTGWLKWLYT